MDLKTYINTVICGDCREVMQALPDDSIDIVVTDPPYGLSFMGKDWDKTLPPKKAFEEMHRILKPGALAFVMSSPRQDVLWRMLSMLEGVGFELTQSYIEWIYKTGFPKAYDVSKGIDKKLGESPEIIGRGNSGGPLTHGTYEMAYLGGRTFGGEYTITAPSSDVAKKWDGWKSQTGLKPAHEPILMVNKPFSESTIVDNVLKWGVGAINVDACRIPFNGESPEKFANNFDDSKRKSPKFSGIYGYGDLRKRKPQLFGGRFPANLLVSDRAIDTGEETGAGVTGSGVARNENRGIERSLFVSGAPKKVLHKDYYYMDVGDQSRYFDLDAWAEHNGFLDVPKPDKAERDYGLKGRKRTPKSKFNLCDGQKERFDGAKTIPRRNTHPTVKPIKLMAYLIQLGCPPDGVVLDPFCGSGTTCIAAKQLVRKYIGIEINPQYAELARSRINAYPVPLTWFDEVEVVDRGSP